jgi:hypothetical protein
MRGEEVSRPAWGPDGGRRRARWPRGRWTAILAGLIALAIAGFLAVRWKPLLIERYQRQFLSSPDRLFESLEHPAWRLEEKVATEWIATGRGREALLLGLLERVLEEDVRGWLAAMTAGSSISFRRERYDKDKKEWSALCWGATLEAKGMRGFWRRKALAPEDRHLLLLLDRLEPGRHALPSYPGLILVVREQGDTCRIEPAAGSFRGLPAAGSGGSPR